MKYNMDQKLKMVHEYLDDKVSALKLSKKYGYDLSKIKYMIKLYEMHGEAPFDERQASRVYTREQKLIAIKHGEEPNIEDFQFVDDCRVFQNAEEFNDETTS